MTPHSIHEIFSLISLSYKHVFVVPLIRFNYPKTDYLYLLYASLLEKHSDIYVHSTSALGHFRFLLAQLLGKKPILHYHWLEFQDYKALLGMIYKIKLIWLYTFFGGKLVWTIHNIKPHNERWLNLHLRLHRWMAKKAHIILVHSASQVQLVAKKYRVKEHKIIVFPHPTFPSEQLEKQLAIDLLNSKFELNIDHNSTIIGSFGAISNYKNLLENIHILDELNFNGKYLIFGYVKKGQKELHAQLIQLSNKHTWLVYKPGFVEEIDIPAIMNSIDICLFNFKDISTSGGVELAKSYDKKMILPRKGTLIDLESTQSAHLFSDEEELKSHLKHLLN